MLGALLAFASAAFFGLNSATVRRGVIKASVLQAMAITVPAGIPVFLLFAAFMGGFAALTEWQAATWGWMIGAGVIHFAIGRYGNYRATQALGAALSAPVQQLSIVVALVGAFVVLGESVTGLNILGILLVMFGPMVILARRKKPKNAGADKDFKPEYGPGMFWGMVAAFGYGSSPVMIALGLGEGGDLADSVAGVLVSYTAATVVVAVAVALGGGRAVLTGMDRNSAFWFGVAAFFVAVSQLCRYMALALVPVSVVQPIQRLSIIFRILFSALINRDYEIIDGWVIATIGVAFAGILALTMDTVFILDVLPLPAFLEELLAWRLEP